MRAHTRREITVQSVQALPQQSKARRQAHFHAVHTRTPTPQSKHHCNRLHRVATTSNSLQSRVASKRRNSRFQRTEFNESDPLKGFFLDTIMPVRCHYPYLFLCALCTTSSTQHATSSFRVCASSTPNPPPPIPKELKLDP